MFDYLFYHFLETEIELTGLEFWGFSLTLK